MTSQCEKASEAFEDLNAEQDLSAMSASEVMAATSYWRKATEAGRPDAPPKVFRLEAELTRRYGGQTTRPADL